MTNANYFFEKYGLSDRDVERYLSAAIQPWLERMGFTVAIHGNPREGFGPILTAERIENPGLNTILTYGHGDTVRGLEDQWTPGLDPWTLTERDGRLYGRGTCDMKGFLALALAAAPLFAAPGRLRRPIHLAFSYDEEVGCLGAPAMIDELVRILPAPQAVIVGEPTSMEVVHGHKGITSFIVTVTGHEAHSSLTHLGLSANMAAIRLMHFLSELGARLEREADAASPFVPPPFMPPAPC